MHRKLTNLKFAFYNEDVYKAMDQIDQVVFEVKLLVDSLLQIKEKSHVIVFGC